MDSDKSAYIEVLENRKKKLNESISKLEGRKSGLFDYNEIRAAQLRGEVKKIDETINKIKASSDTIEIGGLNGFLIDRTDARLQRNINRQTDIQKEIANIDSSKSKANGFAKKILIKMKENRTKELERLRKKQVRLKGRQRFFASPLVAFENYRKYRIGRNEGMVEYRKSQAEDAALLAQANNNGTVIGAIKSSYYEFRGSLYKQSQLRYQNIVDKLKSRVVRVKGAREIDVPLVLAPVLS